MKKTILILAIFGTTLTSQAQSSGDTNFGLGAGLEYGGFGARIAHHPSDNVGIFAGVGYVFAGAGYNVGAQYQFSTESRAKWFVQGMYGYNAALYVEGSISYKEIYYGPSVGFGANVQTRKENGNYWNYSLNVPIKDPAFQRDYDDLEDSGVEFQGFLLPFTITVGFNFQL